MPHISLLTRSLKRKDYSDREEGCRDFGIVELSIGERGARDHSAPMMWSALPKVLCISYIQCPNVLHFPCYVHHHDPLKFLLPHCAVFLKNWLLPKNSN